MSISFGICLLCIVYVVCYVFVFCNVLSCVVGLCYAYVMKCVICLCFVMCLRYGLWIYIMCCVFDVMCPCHVLCVSCCVSTTTQALSIAHLFIQLFFLLCSAKQKHNDYFSPGPITNKTLEVYSVSTTKERRKEVLQDSCGSNATKTLQL